MTRSPLHATPLPIRLIGLAGIVLLLAGSYIGLFVAPPERHMGDVQRMLYVHVPSAWIAMLAYSAAFVLAIATLWTGRERLDAWMVGTIEAGLVLNCLLLVQGSLWGRATWGVWWDWDVRLTTSLLMALLFGGILALRSFIPDPDRRSTWSAIATIVAWVDVPLVYFCVRWWRSLHQVQSSPETMDPAMVLPLRIHSFAILALAVWFAWQRRTLELERRRADAVEPPQAMEVELA
jgi:heme exporter protein C